MIRYILLDIEGTTTDIDFVHKVLFPYSAEAIPEYVRNYASDPVVRKNLDLIGAANNEEAIQTVLQWIEEDRKETALKAIQGLVWERGYREGAYKSHIYEDVVPSLEFWQEQGIKLAIYSSGSVQAQKLLFGYTIEGDLTPNFTHYFDTQVGGKKESKSYQNIAEALGFFPEEILFISDVEAELDAARDADYQTIRIFRGRVTEDSKHPVIRNFEEVQLGCPA